MGNWFVSFTFPIQCVWIHQYELYCTVYTTSSPWKVIEIWNDYILMITYFLWTCLILCRAFVNNVWYIKILSPEDVQKLGKEEVESFSHHAGERTNTSGSDARSLVSGLPFGGSLEYWEWLRVKKQSSRVSWLQEPSSSTSMHFYSVFTSFVLCNYWSFIHAYVVAFYFYGVSGTLCM